MSTYKTFNIALDLKRSSSNREFEVVEGDTGNKLHIVLTDGGTPVTLTGCGVVAVFSSSNGIASQYSGTEDGGVSIGGTAANEVDIELFSNSFAPGMVECELQVFSGPDLSVLVTSAKFNFSCRRSIYNADALNSVPEYNMLSSLLSQVENAVSDMEAAADAAIADMQLAAAEATASMETAANAMIYELENANYHADQHAADGDDPITPADIGAAVTRLYTAALPVAGWSAAAPFTQTVSVSGITAGMTPITDVVLSSTLATAKVQLAEWAKVSKIVTNAGSITVSCFEAKPTAALSISLKVVN